MDKFSKKIRRYFWFARAWLKRHLRMVILFVIFTIASVSTASAVYPHLPPRQTVYIEGIIGSYEPSNLPEEVTSLLSQGLTKIGQDGKVEPELAESWEATQSGALFKFHLLQNKFWTDGTPMIAHDLFFPFADVEVSYKDDHTIEFKMKNPFAPLPSLLAKPAFKKDTLTGSGPYQVESIQIEHQDPLSIFNREQIFAGGKGSRRVSSITISSKTHKPAKIKFVFYDSEEKAVLALKLGQIHALAGLNNFDDLDGWNNFNRYSKDQLQKMVIMFYNTKDKILADRQIRQALTWAITPYEEQVATASSPIVKTSWAYNSDAKKYYYNQEQAKNILTKALGKEATPTSRLSITISTVPLHQNYAKKIEESWEKLGFFDVSLDIGQDLPQRVQDQHDFQAYLITQKVLPDPDQYSLWHSTQLRTNLTGYSSPRIDKLLEDGRHIQDPKQRRQKYLDFQRFLLEDTPAAFLYHPLYNYVVMKKVDSEDIRKLKGF